MKKEDVMAPAKVKLGETREGEGALIRKVLLIASLAAGAFLASMSRRRNLPPLPGRVSISCCRTPRRRATKAAMTTQSAVSACALPRQPDSEEALWYLGSLLYEKEQFAKARDVLRQFLTMRPDAGPGWALLGLSEFQMREYPRALDHLQRAMAQGMGDRKELVQSVYHDVAILLTRFERYDDSLDLQMKMLASDPQQSDPHGSSGACEPSTASSSRGSPTRPPRSDRLAGRAVLAVQTPQYAAEDSSGWSRRIRMNLAFTSSTAHI